MSEEGREGEREGGRERGRGSVYVFEGVQHLFCSETVLTFTNQPSPSLPPASLSTFLPHLFEVHTSERTFLLSAPSEDEMQSWIGMLQTLKQYARNPSPPAPQDRGGNPAPTTPNGISGSANAVLHQLLVDNGSAVGRGKERRSTTFPTTTGISVRKEEEEVGGASTRGDSPTALKRGAESQRRPRSQA